MNKIESKYTSCVHGASDRDTHADGVSEPIYTSTSFGYLDVEKTPYPRYFNTPNQKSLAEKIARLEQGDTGMVFSSGMAAISTVLLSFLRAGDHAIFQNDLYGGTHNAVSTLLRQMGIEYSWVTIDNPDQITPFIKENTKLIYIETPSNPLLKVIDIMGVADIAKTHGITSVIDNTFASPINQNPITLGIDIVIHSGTKYLGGHSDISAGVAVFGDQHKEVIWNQAVNLGGNLDSRTCYLLDRSIKTLALRVEKQNENAFEIASWLNDHQKVVGTHYPGLRSHPDHELAREQMTGFGGMLSFELDVDLMGSDEFARSLQLIQPVISLGGVETIISSPPKTSHSLLTAEERNQMGISDGLLRLSVGIESVSDLIGDLEQALARI